MECRGAGSRGHVRGGKVSGMTPEKRLIVYVCVFVLLVTGCKLGSNTSNTSNTSNKSANSSRAGASPTPATADAGVTGVEKQKPAPGTGNVQGKVLFNGQPVPNNEVKLCEKFNRFFGGCQGKTYTARTDAGGEYVVANVPPMVYEGLLARVFNTDSWIFATIGIGGLNASKYEVNADKTLFVSDANLFKSDLKTLAPKAGAKVSGQGLELKWDAYPDAAYYKFSLYATEPGVTSPYINERVDGASFTLEKPMPKGTYRWELEAYNGDDQKLSENSNDIKFTITDGS
jgi:hypothetical protein